MATYQDHIEALTSILFQSWNFDLTDNQYESVQAGIEALKTLQDMGTYMNKILNNRYKGEDNKP